MFVEIPSFVLSLQKRQGGAALPKWLHFDEELAGRNRLGDTFTSGIKLLPFSIAIVVDQRVIRNVLMELYGTLWKLSMDIVPYRSMMYMDLKYVYIYIHIWNYMESYGYSSN